jgi:N-acetylmuramoyl-L-alanine amidase
MTREPLRRTTNRRAILRGVYEDNLKTVGRASPEPRRSLRRAFRWAPPVLGLAIAGVLLFQGPRAGSLAAGGGTGSDGARAGATASGAANGGFAPADRQLRAAWPADRHAANGEIGVAELYGLELRTIVIDAGHGGADPGAIGPRGLMEKDVTLDVAWRLQARLERYPEYRILMTRVGDEKLLLRERVAFTNEERADLFVSIHINWLPDESQVGVETYFYGPSSDAKARALAARENRNSGYTVAEFNELTRRLGVTLKLEESRQAATAIQESLHRNMARLGGSVSDWGARSGDFAVLLGVEAPSVLAEIATLSNREEEARLNTPEHRERLAAFLEQGIVTYLRQHSTQNGPGNDVSKAEDESGERRPVRRH